MTFHTTTDGEVVSCHNDVTVCPGAISSNHFETSMAARSAVNERGELLAAYDKLVNEVEDESMFEWPE